VINKRLILCGDIHMLPNELSEISESLDH